jgi:hypothetical protein
MTQDRWYIIDILGLFIYEENGSIAHGIKEFVENIDILK